MWRWRPAVKSASDALPVPVLAHQLGIRPGGKSNLPKLLLLFAQDEPSYATQAICPWSSTPEPSLNPRIWPKQCGGHWHLDSTLAQLRVAALCERAVWQHCGLWKKPWWTLKIHKIGCTAQHTSINGIKSQVHGRIRDSCQHPELGPLLMMLRGSLSHWEWQYIDTLSPKLPCYHHWGTWVPQDGNQEKNTEKFLDRFY